MLAFGRCSLSSTIQTEAIPPVFVCVYVCLCEHDNSDDNIDDLKVYSICIIMYVVSAFLLHTIKLYTQ